MYTSYKRSGFDTFPANADDAKHQLAQETTSHWIGPFPAQDFLDFLDVETDEASVVQGNIFSKVPSSAKALEETMYRPLVSRLMDVLMGNSKAYYAQDYISELAVSQKLSLRQHEHPM